MSNVIIIESKQRPAYQCNGYQGTYFLILWNGRNIDVIQLEWIILILYGGKITDNITSRIY